MAYNDVGVIVEPEEYIEYVICKMNPRDSFKYWTGGSWTTTPMTNTVLKYNYNAGISECFKLKSTEIYGSVKLVKLTTTVEDVELSLP